VGLPELLDVVGYNYQEGRYGDDHERFPRRIIYGSENGDSYRSWLAVAQNDYISGQFLWTGIDYLGEAGVWPGRVFPGGLLDLATFKKPDAWWRQALWSDRPMVYLAAGQPLRGGRRGGRGGRRFRWRRIQLEEHWNWAEGSPVTVQCATNCPEVDLHLNGKLLRTLTRDDDQQGWRRAEVGFRPGKLEAVGRDGGRELCRFALRTAGAPRRVQLDSDAGRLAADGHDIAHLQFFIVDKNGVRVPGAEQEIEFTIAGPMRILGIDNGRTGGEVDYQDNRCEAHRGRGLAILQARREAGKARITARAEGLEPGEVALEVE
jgi:hypothetical protein